MSTKERFREELLGRRAMLSASEVSRLSSLIGGRFVATEEFCSSKRLALYAGVNNEVLTDDILSAALSRGKEVYYPKVAAVGGGLGPSGGHCAGAGVSSPGRLVFFRVRDRDELRPGPYAIPEPVTTATAAEADPATFDCIVTPGVAFDGSGARLGFGRGCYDKTLAGLRCPVVALAFELQLVDELPVEPHDVRVSAIVTERRVLRL